MVRFAPYFFYLNFGWYWRRYNLNHPMSVVSANTTRFSPNREMKKKCNVAPTHRQRCRPLHTTSNTGAAPLQSRRCFREFFPYAAPTPFGHGWIAAQHTSCLPPFQHISVFLSSQANCLHFAFCSNLIQLCVRKSH